MGKNQWVVRNGNGWAVRGEGDANPTSRHCTQEAAIDRAESAARREHSELIIQGRDGKIREKNSYGPDHYPPKG
jgi:hypothetical protein